jgi:glycolate dehydrogenase iron-sulfur subunit
MTIEPTHAQPSTLKIIPPSVGPLRRGTHAYDLMRQCIHCGFCLPTCPTYAVLGVEMDSPRGRIYQMQAVAEGRLAITNDFIEHMNCCLACRACETACPSGVQYGKLIEAAREQIRLEVDTIAATEGDHAHGTDEYTSLLSPTTQPKQASLIADLLRRFFFDVMLPSRLITSLVFAGLKFYQRSGVQTIVRRTGLLEAVNALATPFQGKLKIPEELMESATGDLLPAPLSEITLPLGQRRYRVGFISGCIMDQVFRDINEATIRVLVANGCEVITPPQQVCCGALHVHEGETERGIELARHNIDVFEQYNCDAIIINSAGCGSNLKEYGYLLRDDPAYVSRAQAFSKKVKDVSEFLASIELNQQMGQVIRTVTYHDACHLAHGQKIRQQPRQLLKAIPGLTVVDLKESDWCCGSAGIYNILNQEMGAELLERKMNNVAATGADTIATGNPGCMMQIALGVRKRGLPMEVVHPVQLLDQAYSAAGVYSTPVRDVAVQQRQQQTLLIGIGIGILIAAFLLGRRRKK